MLTENYVSLPRDHLTVRKRVYRVGYIGYVLTQSNTTLSPRAAAQIVVRDKAPLLSELSELSELSGISEPTAQEVKSLTSD